MPPNCYFLPNYTFAARGEIVVVRHHQHAASIRQIRPAILQIGRRDPVFRRARDTGMARSFLCRESPATERALLD